MTVGKLTVICWVTFSAMSLLFLPGFALAIAVGDATVPVVGWLVAALVLLLWWGSFGYAMYLSQVVMRRGDPRLRKRGLRGTAQVLSAEQTNTVIQEGEFEWQAPFVYKYRLRVSLPGKEPYETWCRICLAGVRKGETVDVAVSPHNRNRVTIIPDGSDGPTSARSVDSLLGSLADLSRSDDGEDARLHDLDRLGDLRDRGVLSEAEFEAEKARILGD